MERSLGDLVDECIKLQEEIGLLTPILLSLSSSLNFESVSGKEISKAGRERFRDRFERLLGLEKIRAEYARQIREFSSRLLILAERLEEEEFRIENLKPQLSAEQYAWLVSHQKDLKKHLKGIPIR